MKKIWHVRDKVVRHEGKSWMADMAFWVKDGIGELRVYTIWGDVTDRDLTDALQLEADSLGARLCL